MLQQNSSIQNPSLYIEYMPISALENHTLFNDIPKFYWSHVLDAKLQLLWLGGGGSKKNGRLHFDNFENLMTVISGSKTFYLYPPSNSAYLYADQVLRSATLTASRLAMKKCGDKSKNCDVDLLQDWKFERLAEKVNDVSSTIHTYSPVNILNPDYEKFPLLKFAKGFNCTLNEVILSFSTCVNYINVYT